MSSITIVSDDATIWSITYDCHYDDRNSFIIQATGQSEICCQKTTIFHQNFTAIILNLENPIITLYVVELFLLFERVSSVRFRCLSIFSQPNLT